VPGHLGKWHWRSRLDRTLGQTLAVRRLGVTVGADLMAPIGSRVRFTIPLRFTALRLESTGYRTQTNLRIGLGLSVALWQQLN
jgi:hypothetical protein